MTLSSRLIDVKEYVTLIMVGITIDEFHLV